MGGSAQQHRPGAGGARRAATRPWSTASPPCLVVGLLLSLLATTAAGQLVPCGHPSDADEVAAALARIAQAVDPCGETGRVAEVLETLRRCGRAPYAICTDPGLDRNTFERLRPGADGVRTVDWNPTLRSELERGCGGDAARPVLRDPTASLLHELVHVADDCRGLDPGARELDAVRVENVYRRAAGLCQREGYGGERLPDAFVRRCAPDRCSCATRSAPGEVVDHDGPLRRGRAGQTRIADGEAGGTAGRE